MIWASSDAPFEALSVTKWLAKEYPGILDLQGVAAADRIFLLHATDIRKSAARRRRTFANLGIPPLLDVRLQVFLSISWLPEWPRGITMDVGRSIPPGRLESHFYADRVFRPTDGEVLRGSVRLLASQMESALGAARADALLGTLALVVENQRRMSFLSGVLRGLSRII